MRLIRADRASSCHSSRCSGNNIHEPSDKACYRLYIPTCSLRCNYSIPQLSVRTCNRVTSIGPQICRCRVRKCNHVSADVPKITIDFAACRSWGIQKALVSGEVAASRHIWTTSLRHSMPVVNGWGLQRDRACAGLPTKGVHSSMNVRGDCRLSDPRDQLQVRSNSYALWWSSSMIDSAVFFHQEDAQNLWVGCQTSCDHFDRTELCYSDSSKYVSGWLPHYSVHPGCLSACNRLASKCKRSVKQRVL
jgi:hypothetical protein